MEHINSRMQKTAGHYNEFATMHAMHITAGWLWGWNGVIAKKVLWKYASAIKKEGDCIYCY